MFRLFLFYDFLIMCAVFSATKLSDNRVFFVVCQADTTASMRHQLYTIFRSTNLAILENQSIIKPRAHSSYLPLITACQKLRSTFMELATSTRPQRANELCIHDDRDK